MSANSRKVSPLAWVPTVYFAMGLPFIIVNMVATLMFRGLGIDDARITLWTSLIILPWVCCKDKVGKNNSRNRGIYSRGQILCNFT